MFSDLTAGKKQSEGAMEKQFPPDRVIPDSEPWSAGKIVLLYMPKIKQPKTAKCRKEYVFTLFFILQSYLFFS
jgi:hypothetical protein